MFFFSFPYIKKLEYSKLIRKHLDNKSILNHTHILALFPRKFHDVINRWQFKMGSLPGDVLRLIECLPSIRQVLVCFPALRKTRHGDLCRYLVGRDRQIKSSRSSRLLELGASLRYMRPGRGAVLIEVSLRNS